MKQIQVVYSIPQMEEMWYLYCHLPWSCRYKCLMCLTVWRAEHVSMSTCSHIFARASLFFSSFYHFLSFFITFYHFLSFFNIFYHFCVYHLVFKILSKLIPTNLEAKIGFLRFLYTQQLTKDGIISIHKISTTRNTADILTKYISRETLQRLLYAAGLHARA